MKHYFYLAKKFLIVPVVLLLFMTFTGVFKIYQTGTLKKDGSAVFNLTYSGNISMVEKNRYSLGNFAFGEDNVKKYFTSPNSEVKKVKISKSDKDTLYYVETEIEIKDINKLGSTFGFSDFSSSWKNSDSVSTFNYIIKSNERTQLINSFQLKLTFEDEIKSSNGQVKDKTVEWFQSDFSKEKILTATLKTSGSKSNEQGKGCGLFGMELPIILVSGLVFALKKKNN